MSNINNIRQFKYDVYLSGPWEKHCKTPYKTMIKNLLPFLSIYDPEDYQNADWFEDDLEAIQNSKCIICYANNIPMSASVFEIGYFFALSRLSELDSNYSRHIIIVWEDVLEPTFAKKWHARSGYLVNSIESAVSLYKKLYKII